MEENQIKFEIWDVQQKNGKNDTVIYNTRFLFPKEKSIDVVEKELINRLSIVEKHTQIRMFDGKKNRRIQLKNTSVEDVKKILKEIMNMR